VARPKAPPPLPLDAETIAGLMDRARAALSAEDCTLLAAILSTLVSITELVAKKRASLRRLQKLLFGVRTEKAAAVLPPAEAGTGGDPPTEGARPPARKAKGHGRNAAKDYPGATRVLVAHPTLKPAELCPECSRGRLYRLQEGLRLVRFRGRAALDATVTYLEQLRCALCGRVFTAPAPAEVGGEKEKYAPSAAAMIAVLRYGAGLPLHRLARLQASVGLPLPVSTQWDVLHAGAGWLRPVLVELTRQSAQSTLVHNDDTPMKVLSFLGQRAQKLAPAEGAKPRAVFTSGVVWVHGEVKIALFFTGQRHAGENLAQVLAHRARELPPPIHMCDALSRNLPKPLATILAHCLAHGRRQFVDVAPDFPEPCRVVIDALAEVYRTDALALELTLGPAERLALHQARSRPVMDELRTWLLDQRDEKRVEPNSGLGQAIAYMLKHWHELTLFLRVAGAPLDNNLCERMLKKAILHRKNSLFYKTPHGADVGDLYMSLIHTCELNGVNPLAYLAELLTHKTELQANPADWMPWNYAETLARRTPQATSPPAPAAEPSTRRPAWGPAPPAPARRSLDEAPGSRQRAAVPPRPAIAPSLAPPS